MKLSPYFVAGALAGGKNRNSSVIDALENTIKALGNDQNALFNDTRFQKNLKKRFNFLRKYYQNAAECATGEAPDFYVESNLESIGSAIQAYHDAVFAGEGKKCDRKRNRDRVERQISKVNLFRLKPKHDLGSSRVSNYWVFLWAIDYGYNLDPKF